MLVTLQQGSLAIVNKLLDWKKVDHLKMLELKSSTFCILVFEF